MLEIGWRLHSDLGSVVVVSMSTKSLRHWAEAWYAACQYANVYNVELSLAQFAASHCLEAAELEELEEFLGSGVRL